MPSRPSKIVPSMVNILLLLFDQYKLHCQTFQGILLRLTVTESTEIFLTVMNLLQTILEALNRGLRMVVVPCHKVKIH